jgi:regulatory protein YycH of two-component signal transduction system YycFG
MIVEIILGVLVVISIFATYYFKIKAQIEQEAIGAINDAESTNKIGQEKMKQAIEEVNKIIPSFLKPIFNDEFLELIIQSIFDRMKEFAEKQAEKKKIGGKTNGS